MTAGRSPRSRQSSDGPAALLLEAAGQVDADDDAHRWRDDAVRHAVGAAWQAGNLTAVGDLAAGYDALLLQAPTVENGRLRLRPIGNAERRHRGAFSTPPVYASALAGRALSTWSAGERRSAPSVVDPACGAGALLRAVLAQLLGAGVPGVEAAEVLHGVDADPVAVLLCRAALAADLTLAGHPCRPEQLADRIVAGDALLGETPVRPAAGPGVVWHELFPAVLARPGAAVDPVTGWQGGFDVVVANPPWERLKVHARDWDGTPPPGLRVGRAGAARALRDVGRHPLTGAGELNAYLPFVETCWRLMGPLGRAALLVPAGIASDRSAARLLEALTGAGVLDRLHLIEPAGPIFAGVSGRVGVAVVELAGGPQPGLDRAGRVAEVAVGLAGPNDPPGDRRWPLTADLLRVLNPNTGTAPLFGSATDARIVTAVHRRIPVLLRREPVTGAVLDDAWQLRLITPLHMTRDAPRFRDAPGEGLLPLWEAKHCGLLDPHGGGTANPRYWVTQELVQERYGPLCDRGWLAGYRNVSTSAGVRTLLPAPLPVAGVGNSLPLISADRLPLLLSALASLPVDYLVRQKHAGANVNFFKLEQVPLPRPGDYDRPSPWGAGTIADWVLARFAEAVVWAPGLQGLADELRRDGVPVPSDNDPAVRTRARAELDAVHAVLLGLSRDELGHLLDTFGALRAKEEKLHGCFATAQRVLAAYDRLS
jgi:N-6 DNA methylase